MTTVDLNPDCPHSPDRTHAATRVISDAARYLNHATRPGSAGLEHATDVYEVLASLSEATDRLPQLLAQLGAFLAAKAAEGSLGDDKGRDPAIQAGMAAAILEEAAERLGSVAVTLRLAQNDISGLYALEGGDL